MPRIYSDEQHFVGSSYWGIGALIGHLFLRLRPGLGSLAARSTGSCRDVELALSAFPCLAALAAFGIEQKRDRIAAVPFD